MLMYVKENWCPGEEYTVEHNGGKVGIFPSSTGMRGVFFLSLPGEVCDFVVTKGRNMWGILNNKN